MAYEEILYSTKGAVGYLTLNNPKKINALSKLMIREIIHALDTVAADEGINVLVIRAAGNHFCAGHYMAEMVDGGVREYKFIFDQCTKMMEMIHEIPQPVIAQVQGIATAAGCQLAAWCDLVVAEEGAQFATPGVKIGLFCTTPGVAVARAIGRKPAMEMLLTGERIDAARAYDIGLINKVVPKENLMEEAMRYADAICKNGPLAVRTTKEIVIRQAALETGFVIEKALATKVFGSHDAEEGPKAFMEKRKPNFKGC